MDDNINRPFAEVPPEVWDDLRYQVGREGLDYDDNYRAYRVHDGFLKEAFVQADRNGCCGSYESSTLDATGAKWIIGCNHGH